MDSKNICIIGGTGFVGSALVNRLSRLKHNVKVFSRSPEKNKHLKLLPGVVILNIDYFAPKVMERHFDSSDVIINLAGILNPQGSNTFDHVHAKLTRRIVEAVNAVDAKRYLHMSALNAGNKASKYLTSKGIGQQLAHQCKKTTVTVFCPSIIYGPNDNFFNLFAKLLKLPGKFPVIGSQAKFAPIYVEDVVDAFINSIDNCNTYNKNFNLCGPKQYSLMELVQYTNKLTKSHCELIELNRPLSRIMANVFNLLPGSPISLDNYKSMMLNSVCDQPVAKELQLNLSSLESVLPLYLGDKERNKTYNSFRSKAKR